MWTSVGLPGIAAEKNPYLGAVSKGPFIVTNQPAIPLNDTDTPPTTNPTIPITGRDAERLQAIANTAGFFPLSSIEFGDLKLHLPCARLIHQM